MLPTDNFKLSNPALIANYTKSHSELNSLFLWYGVQIVQNIMRRIDI